MDTKQQLNLPPFNWDKFIKYSFAALLGSLALALIFRTKTLVRLLEVIDALVFVGILIGLTYAIIKRFAK